MREKPWKNYQNYCQPELELLAYEYNELQNFVGRIKRLADPTLFQRGQNKLPTLQIQTSSLQTYHRFICVKTRNDNEASHFVY